MILPAFFSLFLQFSFDGTGWCHFLCRSDKSNEWGSYHFSYSFKCDFFVSPEWKYSQGGKICHHFGTFFFLFLSLQEYLSPFFLLAYKKHFLIQWRFSWFVRVYISFPLQVFPRDIFEECFCFLLWTRKGFFTFVKGLSGLNPLRFRRSHPQLFFSFYIF